MAEHTPGRLETRPSNDGRFAVGRIHKWPAGDEAWAAMVITPPEHWGPFSHQHEANARRLAAAWNACEGIDTSALEQGVVADLLAACEAALRELGGYDPNDLEFESDLCGQLRAAIARARGEQ